jgi:hypothetical protein
MLLFDCSLPINEIIKKNKLLYWFHFLSSQIGSDTPVIIIATKLDILQKNAGLFAETLPILLKINEGNKKFN